MSNDIDYSKLIAQGNEWKEKLTEGSRYDLIKGVAFGYLLGRVYDHEIKLRISLFSITLVPCGSCGAGVWSWLCC